MRSIITLLFILCFIVSNTQSVVPSDRVQSHVNVRNLPSSSSEIIDSLRVGEFAELITDSIPYWYKIILDDTGYVSKAWTKVILRQVPYDKNDLCIGSWNIKWFGYYKEDKHNYKAMADIIQTFDVMAIQELRGDRFQARMDSIVSELGRRGYGYKYIFSEETGYDDNPDAAKKDYLERYAYIWDTDRIEILNPDTPYHFICDPAINNDHFRQVPMVSSFKLKGGGGFDFTLATIHTVYSKDINHVRASEIQYLHNWINAELRDTTTSEKDIFIIGDFNANPPNQPAHFNSIVSDTSMYRVVLNEPLISGEDPIRTTILVKANIKANDLLAPVYDHLLMSKHTTYAWPNTYPFTWESGYIGVITFDQDSIWSGRSRNEVIRAMSDHRPIWISLPYDTEDRD